MYMRHAQHGPTSLMAAPRPCGAPPLRRTRPRSCCRLSLTMERISLSMWPVTHCSGGHGQRVCGEVTVDGCPGQVFMQSVAHTSNGGQGSSVPLVSHASNANFPTSLLDCFAHRGANRRQQHRKACSPRDNSQPAEAHTAGWNARVPQALHLAAAGLVAHVLGSDLEHRHVACTRGKRPSVGPHCLPGPNPDH